jgi:hypothetical protein
MMMTIGKRLIGPFDIEDRTTAAYFLNSLPLLLQDIPLQTKLRMCSEKDGAPPHVSRQIIATILLAGLVVVVHNPGLRGLRTTRPLTVS